MSLIGTMGSGVSALRTFMKGLEVIGNNIANANTFGAKTARGEFSAVYAAALNGAGSYPGVHYQDNTVYRMYAHGAGTCPRAHRASGRLVSLPMHMGLTRADVERVAESLRQVVARRRSTSTRGLASADSIG